jgi:hypothetical protein
MLIPKSYELLDRCIEDGVAYGWMRAHKHTDAPDAQRVQDEIVNAVMNEICAWFEFKGVENEQSIK